MGESARSVAVLLTLAALGIFAERAAAAVYHLDCSEGADGLSGASPGEAWRSLGKTATADLKPGDRLLLKRGCAWTGPLDLPWIGTAASPIIVGAYGSGPDPIVEDGNPANVTLTGRYLEVESLTVRSKPVAKDPGCRDQPVGYRSGFLFPGGSSRNTLRRVSASGHSMGVFLAAGSRHNRVLYSEISGNSSLTVNDKTDPDNDAGAFGILINGDSNEIAYNALSNNLAWCSYDYGIDGASVEIYDAVGNRIHHNRSAGEGAFTELGGSRTRDNVFAYNLVVSDVEAGIFLNVRGRTSKWGPNLNTVAAHNTVYLTGALSQGVVCTGGCAEDILVLRDNIIWTEWKAAYVDGQPREDHNLYWKTGGAPLIQNLVLHASSRKADPRFLDAGKGDFHLMPGSPAMDGGAADGAAALGYLADLEGNAIPAGLGPDMGCFEGKPGTALRFKAGTKGLAGSGPERPWLSLWNRYRGMDAADAFDAKGRRHHPP